MALIANHDGEIQNFKKFQSNITEQMEDIKVFIRDKPRNKPHDMRPQVNPNMAKKIS